MQNVLDVREYGAEVRPHASAPSIIAGFHVSISCHDVIRFLIKLFPFVPVFVSIFFLKKKVTVLPRKKIVFIPLVGESIKISERFFGTLPLLSPLPYTSTTPHQLHVRVIDFLMILMYAN